MAKAKKTAVETKSKKISAVHHTLSKDKEIELAIRNEAAASLKFEEINKEAQKQKEKVNKYKEQQQDAQREYLEAVEQVKANKEKEISLAIQEAKAKSALEEAKEQKNIKEANSLLERAKKLKEQSEIASVKKLQLEELAKTQQINLEQVRKESSKNLTDIQKAMELTAELMISTPKPSKRVELEEQVETITREPEVKTIVVTKKQLRKARKAAKREAKAKIDADLIKHLK